LDIDQREDSMARRVKDATLDSRDARRKLKARGKPYYRTIERGLHLGYRKLRNGAGTWVARHYVGEQAYEVEKLGIADDASDADGVAILDFWQAQKAARERMAARVLNAAGKSGPVTVADAMDAYLDFLESNRKSVVDTRHRALVHIYPQLGALEVSALTPEVLRKWHAGLAKALPRARTTPGEAQQYRTFNGDEEAVRRRRSSANRVLTILKAALNHTFNDGKVASDAAWRKKVKPFTGVDAARIRYLTVAEAKRLINACEPAFRKLVEAGLQTGARYGELAALRAHDFNPDAGTVHIKQSKSGKARHVVLTEEGAAFFRQLCTGRAGNELMLAKEDGSGWLKSHQWRPMAEACARAKISPPIGFHGLRHTWASLAVMAGMPLMVVARNLGHVDTGMVERHYGHLAPSYIADAIRARAPRFGFKPDRKLGSLSG
jgi:integrase